MQIKHVSSLLTCAFSHLANILKLYLWFRDLVLKSWLLTWLGYTVRVGEMRN